MNTCETCAYSMPAVKTPNGDVCGCTRGNGEAKSTSGVSMNPADYCCNEWQSSAAHRSANKAMRPWARGME